MIRRIRLLPGILFSVFLMFPQWLAGQSAYTLTRLVQTGDVAPSPHLMGEILESSIDDQSNVVYGADNGLFYYPGHAQVSLFGEFCTPAPGGGKFGGAWSSALSPSGELIFRGVGVTALGKSGLFRYSGGKITSLIPDGTLASNGKALTAQYPVINAAGDFIFSDSNGGLYLYSKGSIRPIALAGQSAPEGGNLTFISEYAISQSEEVAFIAYLYPSGVGVYLDSGGKITKILATGDKLPNGTTFAFPEGVSVNDARSRLAE